MDRTVYYSQRYFVGPTNIKPLWTNMGRMNAKIMRIASLLNAGFPFDIVKGSNDNELWVRSLLCGKDSFVVVAVNKNYKVHGSGATKMPFIFPVEDETIEVSLPDGRLFSGSIVGEADPQTDLALIKISGEDLPVAPLGTSEDLMIGEWAIAMGNPFGYLIRDAHPTVTVGVISALNRDFDASSSSDQVYRDMIQTDASINPGNSGGPLVSSEGKVIGVNTFIFSQSGGSQGIGFAIPVRRVRMIVDDILRYGEVRHNFWTGIHIQEVDRWIAETLGLPADRGAIIYDVEAQSPGEKAGLRRGDVIVAVAGRRVDGTREVREEFAGAVVGQQVELIVVREGRETVVPITLEEMPAARRRRG